MSVSFGFYNSKDGDRKYDAIQMSSIFDGIVVDGMLQHYGGRMIVTATGNDMVVRVATGRAWFNHTWTLNDSILPLTVPESEVIMKRIDAVVIDVDSRLEQRRNQIKIIKGNPAENPARPTLLKERDHQQYPLAYIAVSPMVTSIRQADITNMVGTTACPYCTAPLEKMDIDELVAQWADQWQRFYEQQTAAIISMKNQWNTELQTYYNTKTAEFQAFYNSKTTEINAYFETKKTEWDNYTAAKTLEMDTWISEKLLEIATWYSQRQEDFNTWFEGIQDIITDDVAANLGNRLILLENSFEEYKEAHAAEMDARLDSIDARLDQIGPSIRTELTNGTLVPKNAQNVTGVVPISHGGTGATTANRARRTLFETEAANAEYFPVLGSWDPNTNSFINGGYLARTRVRAWLGLGETLEPLPIVHGGTGANSVEGARTTIFGRSYASNWDYIPIMGNAEGNLFKNGGVTTRQQLRNAMGLGDTLGVLPVANGGTGANNAASARANLGVAYGTTAGTVCQGNDSRLSNARPPTAHTHYPWDIEAGTFSKVIKAMYGRDYSEKRLRNIYFGTTDLVAGSSVMEQGSIYMVYE